MTTAPNCRIVTVHTFSGDRTLAFRHHLFGALDDQRNRRGPGPSLTDCLLFVGHTGVSVDADRVILGFNPDGGHDPIWKMMQRLQDGGAYPGAVRDDAAVFAAARQRGLKLLSFDVALSPLRFQAFQRTLQAEAKRRNSKYTYGFPDGDGDCNCTTWLERLGLPLLSGRMDEFTAVTGVVAQARRRFGACR
jgi:hypothetical protein